MRPKYKVEDLGDGKKYTLCERIEYFSKRYEKWVIVPAGFRSDGASGPAVDIWSNAWWVHDRLCDCGHFADFSICTNWQASTILSDILWSEGRWFRAIYWWPATFLAGGGRCRAYFF